MGVPQMLGDGGCSQIYSLVIADGAIQRVGNWQMLGEGMVERGKRRGETGSSRWVGFRDYSPGAENQSSRSKVG